MFVEAYRQTDGWFVVLSLQNKYLSRSFSTGSLSESCCPLSICNEPQLHTVGVCLFGYAYLSRVANLQVSSVIMVIITVAKAMQYMKESLPMLRYIYGEHIAIGTPTNVIGRYFSLSSSIKASFDVMK